MNSLHRNIKAGEEVVIRKSWFAPAYQDLKFRIFICSGGGFGCSDGTSGTAIFGKFKSDGEECRIEGSDISVKETLTHQEGKKNVDTV